MAEPHHLSRAPISEAIIDFRVKSSDSFDIDQFSKLKSRLADSLPKVEERREGQITFQFGSTGPQAPRFEQVGLHGLFFKSDDEKLIAQFRVDGFTVNRLKPYTSWDSLFPMAFNLWSLYLDSANPEAVTRLALRYINHIPLPKDLSDLSRYLRAGPTIPPEIPQLLGAFFSKVTIRDDDMDIAAHVVQALESDATTEVTNLIIDIDAFKELDADPSDGMIRETLVQLHTFKNLLFFSYLTDEILEQFE